MNKLTEIAKVNGAWLGEGHVTQVIVKGTICMTEDQLRATVEQVCAPMVEALKSVRAEAYNSDEGKYFEVADFALMNHRALIGDKHE